MSFLQRLGGQLSKWQRALANVGDLAPPGNEFLLKLGAKHLQWELADDRMFGGLSEGAISLGEDESIRFSGATSLELSAEAKQIKNDKGKSVTRTGWCAIQADVRDEEWEWVTIRVRGTGRFRVRLRVRVRVRVRVRGTCTVGVQGRIIVLSPSGLAGNI